MSIPITTHISSFLFGPEGGRVEDSRWFFFSFFSCRDLVIINFLGNLRRAIKLVLNSPTRLSAVVSVVKVNSEKIFF